MITFCTALLCLLGIWSISTGAGHEGRYLETSDMAILPIAIEAGLLLWRRKSAALWRAGLALMAALYLVIPFLYGFISVGAKVMRVPRHFRLSSTHLYNELMANDDLEAVRAGLLKDFNPATDIWYLPDPSTALELPGRAIIQHADFTDIAVLERNHFLSSAPLRVWVLLPPRFEASGKGTVIRRSFSQAGPWTSRSVPGCHFVLWRSDIQ
jgi:hypothetical protein